MVSIRIGWRQMSCRGIAYIGLKGWMSVVLLFSALGLSAQKNGFEQQLDTRKLPVPNEEKQLFYLQRDPNENTVVYQVNMGEDGKINEGDPVNAYWIRYAEGGERKELNLMQRTMAYGIQHKALGDGDFELRLAAYKDLPLRLSYSKPQGKYVVFAPINGEEAILDGIFVRIVGGSALNPTIAYFELFGRDAQTAERISQRMNP